MDLDPSDKETMESSKEDYKNPEPEPTWIGRITDEPVLVGEPESFSGKGEDATRWLMVMKDYFKINQDYYNDEKKIIMVFLSELTKGRASTFAEGWCCTRSARHGTLFPFLVLAPYLCLRANGRCRAVQARLCRKRCRHVIGLGPYLLSMTSSPSALVAVMGFSSFHFRFAPSDKCAFCHSSLVTLYPAPLLPLVDNGSIAWSVCVPVQYI